MPLDAAIGAEDEGGALRQPRCSSSLTNCQPSITGIIRSSRMQAGFCWRRISSASWPFDAIATP